MAAPLGSIHGDWLAVKPKGTWTSPAFRCTKARALASEGRFLCWISIFPSERPDRRVVSRSPLRPVPRLLARPSTPSMRGFSCSRTPIRRPDKIRQALGLLQVRVRAARQIRRGGHLIGVKGRRGAYTPRFACTAGPITQALLISPCVASLEPRL